MRVNVTVNGERRQVDGGWEGESLLHVLRERVGLPGSKNASEQGECGSCSVHLDRPARVRVPGASRQAEGSEVVTIEGLTPDAAASDHSALHPIQQAFLETGAVQCGFCTPGFIVATHDLLTRNPDPGNAEIREALAANLCRCTGYGKIIDAVRLAAGRGAGGGSS